MIKEDLDYAGVKYIFEYEDCDDFSVLPYDKCKQVRGVCFYKDKIVIGYQGTKRTWGFIGGSIEKGETFEQTLRREIKEESNIEVLCWKPIGYQKVFNTRDNSYIYQLRVVAKVHPYGEFVKDPAGSITEIKIIDPATYKQYFDWGKIGDRIMERALEIII